MTSARTRQKTRGPFRFARPGALSSSDTEAGEQVPVFFMRRSRYNIPGDWSANLTLSREWVISRLAIIREERDAAAAVTS